MPLVHLTNIEDLCEIKIMTLENFALKDLSLKQDNQTDKRPTVFYRAKHKLDSKGLVFYFY